MERQFHSPEPPPPSASGSQAADRAGGLLVLVLEAERPPTLGELAALAGLPKSTASRLVGALERHGLIRQDGHRGRLHPGPALLRFAHRGTIDRQLVELAQQPLEALAAATGETINLAVPTPLGVEHLAQVDSRHFLGTGQWVGRRVDYHTTAVGKVFLAFGAAEPPEGPLARLAPATIVDRDELAAQLRRVATDGFALAVEELEAGLTALAAPVHGPTEAVIAALSVSVPTLRLPARRVAEIRPMLIQEARGLSARLGHRDEEEERAA